MTIMPSEIKTNILEGTMPISPRKRLLIDTIRAFQIALVDKPDLVQILDVIGTDLMHTAPEALSSIVYALHHFLTSKVEPNPAIASVWAHCLEEFKNN